MPSETAFQTLDEINSRKWNGQFSAKDAEIMAQKKIQESNKKLAEVEAKFICSMFEKYDTKKTGVLTLDGLTPICTELNIKPWHVIRHVAASGKKGKEVTKEAFLNYWFEQSEKKRFYGNPPVLTPMKKKAYLPTISTDEWESLKKQVVSHSQVAVKMYNEKLVEALAKSSKKFSAKDEAAIKEYLEIISYANKIIEG